MKENKKQIGIILGIISVVIAIIAGIIVINKKTAPSRELSKALDLGNKFLTELNYEEAVIAFNRAIEIDPMNVDAYVGIADAYIGLTNQNTPDDVMVASAKDEMISNLDPYNLSDGAEEKAKIEDFYASALKYCEDALAILNSGYELTKDENIKTKINEITKLKEEIEAIKDNRISDVIEQVAKQELAEFESKLGCKLEDIKVFGLSIYDLADMSPDDLWNYIGVNYPSAVEEADLFGIDYDGYRLKKYKDEKIANLQLCFRRYTISDNGSKYESNQQTLAVGIIENGCYIDIPQEGEEFEESKDYISIDNIDFALEYAHKYEIPKEILPRNCKSGYVFSADQNWSHDVQGSYTLRCFGIECIKTDMK